MTILSIDVGLRSCAFVKVSPDCKIADIKLIDFGPEKNATYAKISERIRNEFSDVAYFAGIEKILIENQCATRIRNKWCVSIQWMIYHHFAGIARPGGASPPIIAAPQLKFRGGALEFQTTYAGRKKESSRKLQAKFPERKFGPGIPDIADAYFQAVAYYANIRKKEAAKK